MADAKKKQMSRLDGIVAVLLVVGVLAVDRGLELL